MYLYNIYMYDKYEYTPENQTVLEHCIFLIKIKYDKII